MESFSNIFLPASVRIIHAFERYMYFLFFLHCHLFNTHTSQISILSRFYTLTSKAELISYVGHFPGMHVYALFAQMAPGRINARPLFKLSNNEFTTSCRPQKKRTFTISYVFQLQDSIHRAGAMWPTCAKLTLCYG